MGVIASVVVLGVVAGVTAFVLALRSAARRPTAPGAPPSPPARPPSPPAAASSGPPPLRDLGEVHDLVDAVHERLRTSHAPLSLAAVVETARSELTGRLRADAVTVLLAEDGGRRWRAVATEVGAGPRPRDLEDRELPVELRDPPATGGVVRRTGGTGLLLPGTSHGAYLWLRNRGEVLGLVVVERHDAPFDDRERAVLEQAAAPLALALSTAVVLERLRGLGAGVERQRIGEQLHDRFAQALAFAGLELDRLAGRYPDDDDLAALRDEVRRTLGELRERLRELRLRCSDRQGLDEVLREHAAHVERSSGLRVRVSTADGFERPPPLVEDQLLRIAIDLLDLARRSDAVTSVQVHLVGEPGRARLVVRDDGEGRAEQELPPASARLLDLVRDRALAIDAPVDVRARPGEGTEVAVTVRDVAAVPRWV
jgi:signal transduction histidine kinase